MSNFFEEILAASTPRTSKADIVEYLQEKYPNKGKGGWKQKIVNTLSDITGMKPKNLEKRFDPQRLNNTEKRNASQYEELARELKIPPLAPNGGYHITGIIWVKYSDGDCVDREIDEMITGDDARDLVNTAHEDMLQSLANYYQTGDLQGGGPGVDSCQSPDLHVEAID